MMKTLQVKDCLQNLQRLGRTYDGANGELFLNWTCSGIRFQFRGTCLAVQFNALPCDESDIIPFDGTAIHRKEWPYAAVFVDDKEEPEKYFEVNRSTGDYLLFSSENEESHTITIRKMTENPKGKLSIIKFSTDGAIEKAKEDSKELKIEFIGDSITCGFGNSTNEKDRLFFSVDENGWMSHAAIAARKLHAEFSMISYSGIAVTKGIGAFQWDTPSMVELYPYTDRLVEETLGTKESFQQWNFKQHKPDVIVLNLGTNDATVIDLNGDIPRGVKQFEEEYYHFLSLIREKNGATPWIICALGSMDYYLFDNIQKVVKQFSTEKHDQKISCFKYGRIRLTDGLGACGHPNLITQKRMGNEIADYITQIMHNERV